MSDIQSKVYFGLHVTYSFFFSDFKEICVYGTVISENNHKWNFTKIRPVGAELFCADRQTDRQDEANVHRSQICESA